VEEAKIPEKTLTRYLLSGDFSDFL